MADLNTLNIASFKNFSFPCLETSTTVGRAQIKHRFVNSNKNNIEDVGGEPRVYNLTAILTGDDYLLLKNRLLQIIESGGKGVLIHPFFGRINNAVARPVTFSESLKNFGRVEIPLVFDIDDSDGIPEESTGNSSAITFKKEKALDLIAENIKSDFSVDTKLQNSFEQSKSKLEKFSGGLKSASTKAAALSSKINSFAFKIEKFTNEISTLILNPERLGGEFTTLINSISNLYDTAEKSFIVLSDLFSFGLDDDEIELNTVARVEVGDNNSLINQSTIAGCLVSAHATATEIDYQTVDQIDEVIGSLEEAFNTDFSILGLDTQNLISEIRNDVSNFLQQERLNVRRTVDQEANMKSARLIAYENYGDSGLGARIARLNKEINVSYLDGNIKVFENA